VEGNIVDYIIITGIQWQAQGLAISDDGTVTMDQRSALSFLWRNIRGIFGVEWYALCGTKLGTFTRSNRKDKIGLNPTPITGFSGVHSNVVPPRLRCWTLLKKWYNASHLP
jgi:hypothetical protein